MNNSISCCFWVHECVCMCRQLCVCPAKVREVSSWTPVTASLTASSRALHYSLCASEGEEKQCLEPAAHNLSIQSAVQTVSLLQIILFLASQVQRRVKKASYQKRIKIPFTGLTGRQEARRWNQNSPLAEGQTRNTQNTNDHTLTHTYTLPITVWNIHVSEDMWQQPDSTMSTSNKGSSVMFHTNPLI